MLIVGELINSTRTAVGKAIEQRDKEYLQGLALRQVEAGARVVDVNAAAGENEIENMKWLVDIVQEVVDVPLCIDSPSAEAIEAGLALCRQRAMINSISAERQRWEEVLPLVEQYRPGVVALCMDDRGMPNTVEDRLRVAGYMVAGLTAAGLSEDDIYLDPLVKPLGVDTGFGMEALDSTRALRRKYPAVHGICGLSNVSYGLPGRRLLNRAFMVMAITVGMDAFILDPLDQAAMSLLAAARALAGRDEFCLDYIAGFREGRVRA